MLLYVATSVLVCAAAVAAGIRRYCCLQPAYVLLPTYLGCLLPLLVIPMLPLDIVLARSGAAPRFLRPLWTFAYWFTFWATWLVIPFVQGYAASGRFAPSGRAADSLWENGLFYGASAVAASLFAALVVLFGGGARQHDLGTILMAAANLWGATLLAALMGHGMARVPVWLWRSADASLMLSRAEATAARAHKELRSAECELSDAVAEVHQLIPNDFGSETEAVLALCSGAGQHGLLRPANEEKLPRQPVTRDRLERIHARLLEAHRRQARAAFQWQELMARARHYQDVLENRHLGSRQWTPSAPFAKDWRLRMLLWHWYTRWEATCRRAGAVCCGALGMLILWAEFAAALRLEALSPATCMAWPPLLFSTVLYMAVCSYSSLMRVRVFSYYMLVPRHSDGKSLLFYASYLCRLMFPLGYNLLALVEGPHQTQFSAAMGGMDLTPILGSHGQLFVAAGLLLSSLASLNRWHVRVFGEYLRGGDEWRPVPTSPDGRRLIARHFGEAATAAGEYRSLSVV